MQKLCIAVMAVGALGGCATYGEVMQYPGHMPGNYASVVVQGRQFLVKLHPTDSTLLMQPTVMESALGGLGSGLTFGAVSQADAAGGSLPIWRAVAAKFFEGSGCGVKEVYQLMSVSWEARYACPAGSTPPSIGKWTAKVAPAQ